MAVQAQYPSNILLLNRNGQDGHDYSLQPQPGGGGGGLFLDQSPMIFNNVAGSGTTINNNSNNNPRKRGREASITTATMNNNIPFSLQHQQQSQQQQEAPQLIDLSQLHNQQPNVVSTGLRLSFGEQQQQLQNHHNHHHHHHQQQQQQQQQFSHSSSSLVSGLAEDFNSQIKQQTDEIDQFLQAQGEQLRRTLAEKRQRHYRALLGAAEETIARMLREKEAEVEKATRRNAELEARAAQLSVEAQLWQAKARSQEATAASLQAQLQQAMMGFGVGCGSGPHSAHDRNRGLDDGAGGLSCAVDVGQAEDAESAYVDPDRVAAVSGPSCRACRKRVASVVLLPCRHLCLCADCDGVVQACPLCLSLRNSSVEVFLS